MSLKRRRFLRLLSGSAAIGALALSPLNSILATPIKVNFFPSDDSPSDIKALLFDAFPIFNPKPIFSLAEELFPGKGVELSSLWRTKQFEYQWLRALSNNYADFWTATNDA